MMLICKTLQKLGRAGQQIACRSSWRVTDRAHTTLNTHTHSNNAIFIGSQVHTNLTRVTGPYDDDDEADAKRVM